MSDATKVRAVDNAHNQLEVDVSEILGIPLSTEITGCIFGANPDGGKPIQADGSIRGILKLLLGYVAMGAGDSVGIEFEDDTEKKRIVLTESELKIYRWDSGEGDWEFISNIGDPGSVKFQSLLDVDVPVGEEFPAPAAAGKFVAVNAVGDKYTHIVAPAGGSTTFAGLTDTPEAIPSDVQMLATDGSGSLYFLKPPRSVAPWGAWYQCGSTTLNDNETKILTDITAKGTAWGWDTPSIAGKTYLRIPAAGIYQFWLREECSAFQGYHMAWLEKRGDYEPIVGPAAVPTYLGGVAQYSGHTPPEVNHIDRWRPHLSEMFSCANWTYVTVNALYEKKGGSVDSISSKFEFSIVRVG